ncbi:zinc ABC transporter permease [Paenibacillus sp. FSL R7-0273]|uniref:metal ABC transporter permease n=1 Tax=Paenibacillus sp. FSL R7-0273 TaxID=1536772 RepID=UPI0004F7587F|nr:metal ABC transporter permease [Paenibacillus sp. FSL R7-0273]AIQ46530.1 zinc ABC transporter permease [Paenibacillus sp. FSL R7-0273]OMF97703.1 zinc ABC transporter permease [Paenibacillus sp. FSL R7-0273]
MEMFLYGFMQRAFQASLIISLIAPLLGLFLILRRQSLMADTLSHVSLAGVALGLITSINPTWTNILMVVVIAVLLEYMRMLYRTYSEVSIAILMSAGMAMALLLISLSKGGKTVSINQFLFGSIVTISTEQIWILLILAVIISSLYLIYRKAMYVMVFDEETAFTAGLPIKMMSILFNMLTGVTIAIIMPIVGALLVSAILILPAAISMRLGKSFSSTILIGIPITLTSMLSGLVTSYEYGTPPGATITLILVAILMLVTIIGKIIRRVKTDKKWYSTR